jgi:hypothetical protein
MASTPQKRTGLLKRHKFYLFYFLHFKEFIKEAVKMAELEHKHIAKLIGICVAGGIKLFTNYRYFRSLNKFLKSHRHILDAADLLRYPYQIAQVEKYVKWLTHMHKHPLKFLTFADEKFTLVPPMFFSKFVGKNNGGPRKFFSILFSKIFSKSL